MSLRRVRSKTDWAVPVFIWLLLAGAAQSEDVPGIVDFLGVSGSGRVSFFSKDSSFVDDPGVECDSVWVTARPRQFDGITTFFDARIQCQFVSGNSKVAADLREGYVDVNLVNWDLKAGRQITIWGRADKINPTDVWSVRDYKLLTTDDGDQQLGALEVQSSWSWGAYRLISIWQPEWRAPVLPIPPFPRGTSISNESVQDRSDQLGFKIDHSGSGMDWSMAYAHTIDRTPNLALLSAGPHGEALGLNYVGEDMLGADFAAQLAKFGFRGEAAYTNAHNDEGLNPLAQDSNVFAVIGIERTWDGVFNLNAQYLFRRTFDFRNSSGIADPTVELLAQEERVISNQLSPNMAGASVRLDYTAMNQTLEAELAAAMWFTKRDSVVTAKLTYAFTDRVTGIVGANVWSGPLDSYFGQLRRTTAVFVEFRYGFGG